MSSSVNVVLYSFVATMTGERKWTPPLVEEDCVEEHLCALEAQEAMSTQSPPGKL